MLTLISFVFHFSSFFLFFGGGSGGGSRGGSGGGNGGGGRGDRTQGSGSSHAKHY